MMAKNLLTGEVSAITPTVSRDGIRQFKTDDGAWWLETVITTDLAGSPDPRRVGYALWAVTEETDDDDPQARLAASSMFPKVGEIQDNEILVMATSPDKARELARLVRAGGRSGGRIPSSENSPSRYPEWENRPYQINWFGQPVAAYVPPAIVRWL